MSKITHTLTIQASQQPIINVYKIYQRNYLKKLFVMSMEIKIAVTTLSEEDSKIISSALQMLADAGKKFTTSLRGIIDAHLLVIDADTEQGDHALQSSTAGQVKLLLATSPASGKNIVAVKKPIEIQSLKLLLEKLFDKMHDQLVRTTMMQVQTEHKVEIQQSTSCKTMLQVLLAAKNNKTVLRICSTQFPDVFIDGTNNSMASTIPQTEVVGFVKQPLDNVVVDQLKSSEFAVHSNKMNIQSLHNTLWVAAIECSNGQLLPDNSLDIPIKLRAWPNFTRNSFKPEYLQLAAILAKQAITLSQLQQLSGVPLKEIINFYNAAHAVDLIDKVEKDTNEPAATKPAISAQKKGLLVKIALRLGLGK